MSIILWKIVKFVPKKIIKFNIITNYLQKMSKKKF